VLKLCLQPVLSFVGRGAAEALLARALRAGLQAHIKLPARGVNDFNDLLMSA
jgi:hypothetical protein